MRHATSHLSMVILLFLAVFMVQPAVAWDSVGHRLSAAVALAYMSESTRQELQEILSQHPRYQQDFLAQMPASISRANADEQLTWLLGQAAYWPDIARGLPRADRDRFNRATWHYIDGAWLRGQAQTQGNSYIGTASLPDIRGRVAVTEAGVDNVMQALDYNSALLADKQAPLPQRALALCWVLHLVGDIHQPLHVGSLYSETRFASGDRGGNGIETDEGNLHARWDRALRDDGVNASLRSVLELHSETLSSMGEQFEADWSLWMHESRALLLNTVYNEEMKSTILRLDGAREALPEFNLSDDYVEAMKYHAGMRLALAGRRIALLLDAKL